MISSAHATREAESAVIGAAAQKDGVQPPLTERSRRAHRAAPAPRTPAYRHNEPLVASLLEQLSLDSFPQDTTGDALFETPGGPLQRLTGNPLDGHSNRFASGAQSLADALAGLLPAGYIALSDPARSIVYETDHVSVMTSNESTAGRHVIVAVPPALAVTSIEFSPDLPVDVHQAAGTSQVWMADMVKAVAVYEAPFWRQKMLAADPRAVHIANWASEECTTPRYRAIRSAQGGFGHPLLQEPAGFGRVHWASTETATAYGGHVEGAVHAGLHVAQEVQKRIAGL